MTPITNRPIPEGYTIEWNKETWNVGFLFIWSEVFENYLTSGRITVRPNETIPEALVREGLGGSDYEVFFLAE